MKKAKRFLTGLLSAALALSLCAMPAMADEVTGETTNTAPLASAIDKNAKGTITIHKYEYNGDKDKEGTGVAQSARRCKRPGRCNVYLLSGNGCG